MAMLGVLGEESNAGLWDAAGRAFIRRASGMALGAFTRCQELKLASLAC